MNNKLSNLPYKGCDDYFPKDLKKLYYIFEKWREVARKYGYEEYLTPVIEHAEVYEAKSGEDIKKELYTFTDNAGRKLSLRPEMTPSVTRMVTRFYGQAPKPIRLFSIANYFRGERPQKGRTREFWQFNIDIFGETSIFADIEIILTSLDIMLAFNPPKGSFVLKLNNRKLIDYFFSEILKIDDKQLMQEVTRKMDKFLKLSKEDFIKEVVSVGLDVSQAEEIIMWLTSPLETLTSKYPGIKDADGYKELASIMEYLDKIGYKEYVTYSSDLIRGFDYYDGIILEMNDMHPDFKRSVFGGGRYNGLAKLFGTTDIPATGYAAGNVSIGIFLDNWNLWPNFEESEETYYIPLLLENNEAETYKLAQKLRSENKVVEMSTEQTTISKALGYANKKTIGKVVIFGTDELKERSYKIKDMKSGDEQVYTL